MKSIKRVLLTSLIVNCSLLIVNAQIYVDADATGNADGTSWTDAYVYLQDALAAASSGDEIWVADGTYYPDEGTSQTNGSRTAYFTLVSGVSLYGGFNGTETSKYQVSPTQNVTILSGDIDKDGVSDGDNSYHVLYTSGLSMNVTIDGFSIQYGYADNSSDKGDGSALYNYETEGYLTISNCTFENNYSIRRGTVLNDVGSDASLTTTFYNCIFKNNTSKNGGAVHNYGRDASGACSPNFINCLFYNNTATTNGGAIFSWAGSSGAANPVLTNCTFYNNTASSNGDAFRSSDYAHSYLTNCIIWQNDSDEWSNNTYGYTTITNCIVNLSSYPTNTTDGGNNINSDPLFEDAASEDFRIQSSSPAKDAGTNSADLDGSGSGMDTIGNITMDLQGLPRLDEENETVDIGAYERPKCECNEIMGTNAGSSLTMGVGNSIYGEEAGVSLNTGSFNSLMGYGAGYSLTSADSSVMIGYQAGYNTTTGSKNIFVGSEAGYNNTVGYNNYYLGTKAGYSNTTGYNNIAIGEEAGYRITTGFNNIIIGEQAYYGSGDMTGRDNIFIGNDKDNCTTGSYNIIVGAEENDLTTGNYNVFFGFGAGTDNSSGEWNTFLGAGAGYNTEYGDYNTFVGSYAGWDNNRTNDTDNANYNTYIGDSCGYYNREGEYNVGIGADASSKENNSYSYCTYIGADIYFENGSVALLGYNSEAYGGYGIGIGAYSNIQKKGAIGMGYQSYLDGQYAIGIGYQDTISANYGIAIGYQANVADKYGIAIGKNATSSSEYSIALGSGASATGYNSAAIGYGASVSGNHEIVFGNTSTTTIGGTVDFTALSDGRFKTDIREDVVGLDFIRELRPVTYQLQVSDTFKVSDTYYSGFIAQEVEQASKNTNFNFSGIDKRRVKTADCRLPTAHCQLPTANWKYGLRYAEFVVPLTKAIQEIQPKIEQQKRTIQEQDAQLGAYKAELLKLAAEIKALEQQ